MSKMSEVMESMVSSYLHDADGWDERYIKKHAGDFYSENSHCVDDIDDDELMSAAEEAYRSSRDWPDVNSLRDGILYLAVDAMAGEFQSAVNSAISDFGDFEALFKCHPYRGQEPDVVYEDDDVSVFWDEDHHVAIKTVLFAGDKFYLDVSSEYDFESDALLQLKRSAHGQENGGGGEEEAA